MMFFWYAKLGTLNYEDGGEGGGGSHFVAYTHLLVIQSNTHLGAAMKGFAG